MGKLFYAEKEKNFFYDYMITQVVSSPENIYSNFLAILYRMG